MDTRTKILTPHELEERLQGRNASSVSGFFDPLLAKHVRRLKKAHEPGRALAVEATDPPRPLLAQRARTELVAALAMVNFVVLGDGSAGDDRDICESFVEHVLHRHAREAPR